ncbi:MAG: polyketide synthase [Planctomycetota bacterium]
MASNPLDPHLSSLLQSLRVRVRRYVVWDSLLAIAAVVLVAFWVGLALDYLPVQLGGTEMPRLARTMLLLLVAVAVVVIAITMLFGRLVRPLPDDSLALLVERHHPSLGGRLVTAVQLNEPGRKNDSHSPSLLQVVHQQAASAIDEVDPNRVFRWQPLMRKAMVVLPLGIAFLGLLLVSPEAFGRATGRLTLLSDDPWPRRAQLEMVGIELPVVSASDDETVPPKLIPFDEGGSIRLPKGSSGTLRIRALADGAELPVLCTVYYTTESGTRGQSNMRRVGRVVDGYQSFILDGPPLAGLSESLSIDIRGLDDRLDDFRIEAVDPPALTEMTMVVTYPDYLRAEGMTGADLETAYQSGLRVREGSEVKLVASSSVPLGDIDAVLKTDAGEQSDLALDFSDDGMTASLTLKDFATATTVSLVPSDSNGISAQAPYRYFLGVVLDEPPELELKLKGIGTAVTPIARVPVEVKVIDDYGVDHLTISASPSAEDATVASLSPSVDRDGEASAVLDLRDLITDGKLSELVPGGAVSIFGEADDRYDLGDKHLTRSEVFRLEVVTPDQLLALLERRELALRARLEQTLDETRNLRDTLDLLLRRGLAEDLSSATEEEVLRQVSIRRLRVQQSGLQATKTSEELSGIATSLDDILQEMVNNRVDSVDRRERIGTGVRDPLRRIVDGSLARLQMEINTLEEVIADVETAKQAAESAVQTSEEVLLELTAILEKMLDLESYNEILDLVRELIEDQDKLLDDTKEERKRQVLELFK